MPNIVAALLVGRAQSPVTGDNVGSDLIQAPPKDGVALSWLGGDSPAGLSEREANLEPHPYYKKVRTKKFLRHAWRKVHENGLQSKSDETVKAVRLFSESAEQSLERIARKLQKEKWSFEPADGILIKRQGKSPRPIVKASIPNRIVQRSILDVLQAHESIQKYLSMPTSYGGIKHRGVREALEDSYRAVSDGRRYYIRSDIKDFFTKIPKDFVINRIVKSIADNKFIQLLKDATDVELKNITELKQHSSLFPLHEIGVAQGCCLSPLFGNILLYDFDKEMNKESTVCLRYIDDFIIFSVDQSSASKAFKKAKKILAKHRLGVYDPNIDEKKAQAGPVAKGFTYLGCDIVSGLITPCREARRRLLDNVKKILKDSMKKMNSPNELAESKMSFIETLRHINNTILGWGNQYSFCNHGQLFDQIDQQINSEIDKYIYYYHKHKNKLSAENDRHSLRKLLGVQLISECKKNPILPLK